MRRSHLRDRIAHSSGTTPSVFRLRAPGFVGGCRWEEGGKGEESELVFSATIAFSFADEVEGFGLTRYFKYTSPSTMSKGPTGGFLWVTGYSDKHLVTFNCTSTSDVTCRNGERMYASSTVPRTGEQPL